MTNTKHELTNVDITNDFIHTLDVILFDDSGDYEYYIPHSSGHHEWGDFAARFPDPLYAARCSTHLMVTALRHLDLRVYRGFHNNRHVFADFVATYRHTVDLDAFTRIHKDPHFDEVGGA